MRRERRIDLVPPIPATVPVGLALEPVTAPYRNLSRQRPAQQFLNKIVGKILNAHKIRRGPLALIHHSSHLDHGNSYKKQRTAMPDWFI